MTAAIAGDWRERCREKRLDAQAAVCGIRRGQRVFIGSGAAEPQSLVAALVARSRELADTEIIHILTLGSAPYSEAGYSDAFRHNAFFIGPNVRGAVEAGRADYTPVFLHEIPRLFRSRRVSLDVALIQVSPPDEDGFCSYGVSVDVVKAAAESAGTVIAEVNPQMPRTCGDSLIHVDRIAALMESDTPLLEAVPSSPDEVAMRIGGHVARLIDDGATLQLGIGSLPNAVLACLREKKDLGIHTEMFSDGLIDLIEAGVVTGTRKTLLPAKVVASFCMGTRRLYEFVDRNPLFEFHPVEFTNDPGVIAQNERMAALNAALEVDLTGQVCADSLGYHFYSGIGGQVDFIRGAARAEGGKPIILLRSTAGKETISRIVPHLREGAGVVTTRGDVHYVVTEYGAVNLWGKSVRERALALIAIAHPKFRADLLEQAKAHGLAYRDQLLLPAAAYPAEWETEATLRDGSRLFFRPIRPTDEPLLKDLLYGCSDESLYHRFFAYVRATPYAQLQRMVNVDYEREMAVVGIAAEAGQERMVAVGRYVLDPDTRLAEVAFLVQDQYQGRGIGTFLLQQLMRIARSKGVAGFTADVLADNRDMLDVLHRSGCDLRRSLAGGVYHLELRFPPESED
jgi:acyl-CoA hydrolase/GNAT superfamily N-acetyltransferase